MAQLARVFRTVPALNRDTRTTLGSISTAFTGGVATNVSHVDNYDADYFYNHYIGNNSPLFNPTRVVNQSFAFATNDESVVDPAYDNYAAYRNTIFVSGVGNGGIYPILPPGTAYNSIGVALYFSPPLVSGPTVDGRCKPDIVAPDVADLGSEADSYAIPYVAGAAAILVQAANRRDGGANTNAASDLRTVKALLLNGAIKPAGWTNGTASPLDARYGAGLVNVFNSWEQLKGGQHAFIESTTVSSGGAHPPGANTNNEPVLAGWDYNTNSTTTATDTVKHYYFNLPGGNSFTLAATLVWNKQYAATNINNLNLFLYNAANSNLVTCSTSMVDNVEHVFLPALPAGRYDLQVLKSGSVTQVSTNETYALAFEIFNMPLSVRLTNSNCSHFLAGGTDRFSASIGGQFESAGFVGVRHQRRDDHQQPECGDVAHRQRQPVLPFNQSHVLTRRPAQAPPRFSAEKFCQIPQSC